MSIVGIVLVLLFVGFIFWIIQTAPIPIHPWIKMVIMGVIAFALLIWLLNVLGVHTGIAVRL
jgi:hypothetical protein